MTYILSVGREDLPGAEDAMGQQAKTWSIVWGWFGPSSYQRESFTEKTACWKRVQEIMAMKGSPWAGAPERHVAELSVWSSRSDGKPGKEVAEFKRYEAGTKFCQWGQWGVTKSKTTGEVFG
jgi:hypothetical protein